MNADEIRQRCDAVQWWHGGMELAPGIVTAGGVRPAIDLLPRIGLPENLWGMRVLDVGTWDGFMAWECERRGAMVVAVDSFVWQNKQPQGGTGRAGFDLCREVYGSNVEAVECDVIDLDYAHLGSFDLVLFLGVLYHMRHPLMALERIALLVSRDGTLILETHVTSDMTGPAMRFYPDSEWRGDPTNWWGPNVECVEAMLRDVGFSRVEHVSTMGDRVTWHASYA